MSPSGGLVWHTHALRYRRMWRPFCDAVADWLAHWPHQRRDLLLFGPSAGWCLPSEFLAGFRHIHAVDIDPLAPWLFRRLHGARLRQSGATITWQRTDLFSVLESLQKKYPDYAILFSNVLGQHRLHCDDVSTAEADLRCLSERLEKKVWASFHDRLSVNVPSGGGVWASVREPRSLSSMALAQRFGGAGVWLDHLTAKLIKGENECLYLPWPITPSRLHVVEAGWNAAGCRAG